MIKRILISALLALSIALPAQAMSVIPLDLNDIVANATTAFQGRCTANRTERDAQTGLIVTYTTFEVQETLKGQVGVTHTIKQIGGELAGNQGQVKISRVEGVPTFKVGETYVIFLYGVSTAGFSSPVGLSQGKFNVQSGPSGLEVGNGRDFREMSARIPVQQIPAGAQIRLQQTPGPVDKMNLDDFKQLVRQQTGVTR